MKHLFEKLTKSTLQTPLHSLALRIGAGALVLGLSGPVIAMDNDAEAGSSEHVRTPRASMIPGGYENKKALMDSQTASVLCQLSPELLCSIGEQGGIDVLGSLKKTCHLLDYQISDSSLWSAFKSQVAERFTEMALSSGAYVDMAYWAYGLNGLEECSVQAEELIQEDLRRMMTGHFSDYEALRRYRDENLAIEETLWSHLDGKIQNIIDVTRTIASVDSGEKEIHLAHCGLLVVPSSLRRFHQLETLWLYGNEISLLESDTFVGLHALRSLNFESNQIREIQNGTFDGSLSLECLYLEYNKISNLQAGVFDGLQKLIVLHIFGNQIANLHPSVFAQMKVLRDLFLAPESLSEKARRFVCLDTGDYSFLYGNNIKAWIEEDRAQKALLDEVVREEELDISSDPS